MKIYFKFILVFFFTFALLVNASVGRTHEPKKRIIDTCELANFSVFKKYGLEIDSCSNRSLYAAVYNYLGVPYRSAGRSERGFDCSGFASTLYKVVFNKKIIGSASDIFKTTKPLSKSELQEGDLIFFKRGKGRIFHVGVYLANNKFAHSESRIGVTISDMNENYWRRYFYKGGRLTHDQLSQLKDNLQPAKKLQKPTVNIVRKSEGLQKH